MPPTARVAALVALLALACVLPSGGAGRSPSGTRTTSRPPSSSRTAVARFDFAFEVLNQRGRRAWTTSTPAQRGRALHRLPGDGDRVPDRARLRLPGPRRAAQPRRRRSTTNARAASSSPKRASSSASSTSPSSSPTPAAPCSRTCADSCARSRSRTSRSPSCTQPSKPQEARVRTVLSTELVPKADSDARARRARAPPAAGHGPRLSATMMAVTAPTSPAPAREILALADGVELIGEYEDSGFKEPPLLARRADGQMIQLTRLLYLVAEAADGRRDEQAVAAAVSERFGRPRERPTTSASSPTSGCGRSACSRCATAPRRSCPSARRCSRCAAAGRSCPNAPSTASRGRSRGCTGRDRADRPAGARRPRLLALRRARHRAGAAQRDLRPDAAAGRARVHRRRRRLARVRARERVPLRRRAARSRSASGSTSSGPRSTAT